MKTLKIAIAQFNATVGDFAGNGDKLLDFAQQAADAGADVLLTPELALCGYPPEDLLFAARFRQVARTQLAELIEAGRRWPHLTLVVGHPEFPDDDSQAGVDLPFYRRCLNAASVLRNGERLALYAKQRLPNDGVFDEMRYFLPGEASQPGGIVDIAGVRCALAICEDIWCPGVAQAARELEASVLLVLNASPMHLGRRMQRESIVRREMSEYGLAVVYANLVGGQDELVFDGASFVLDAQANLQYRLPQFVETLSLVCLTEAGRLYSSGEADALPGADFSADSAAAPLVAPALSEEDEAWQALVLGVRDYVAKNSFPGVLVGLSGGVDSALTLCIAVEALGARRVRALIMPSPYTAQMSLDDARALAGNLGVHSDEIPIEPAMQTLSTTLAAELEGDNDPADTTLENLQARIRGMILMAISNKTGALVLTTGNKSEMAVGYATLYGDMAGGFAVLKDVYKTLVYKLARAVNVRAGLEMIPSNIIERVPSAELRHNQTDQDTLPPYDLLDAVIALHLDQHLGADSIIASGYPHEVVHKVLRMLRLAEYKRRQAPIGVRITPRGFGKDWRYPISNRFPG